MKIFNDKKDKKRSAYIKTDKKSTSKTPPSSSPFSTGRELSRDQPPQPKGMAPTPIALNNIEYRQD